MPGTLCVYVQSLISFWNVLSTRWLSLVQVVVAGQFYREVFQFSRLNLTGKLGDDTFLLISKICLLLFRKMRGKGLFDCLIIY